MFKKYNRENYHNSSVLFTSGSGQWILVFLLLFTPVADNVVTEASKEILGKAEFLEREQNPFKEEVWVNIDWWWWPTIYLVHFSLLWGYWYFSKEPDRKRYWRMYDVILFLYVVNYSFFPTGGWVGLWIWKLIM